jgi:hypothetical protein
VPGRNELREYAYRSLDSKPREAAAALDFLSIIEDFGLSEGFLTVQHPFKSYSIQAAAYRMGVPFTGHPMFGHDIIYTHPMNSGASIGRTAERDFLDFVQSISQIDGGVYLSVGSAVMSPMIFEKSLSMARNLSIQNRTADRNIRAIRNHTMYVVDLAGSVWDWKKQGEPPEDSPDYYLRFLKTFSRMGGRMTYIQADNRDFLLALAQELL